MNSWLWTFSLIHWCKKSSCQILANMTKTAQEKSVSRLPDRHKKSRSDRHSRRRILIPKKVRDKTRECHNHKPQPFPDPKRKRKPTNLNKHKPNKRTKSTKFSSLFPKRGNRNTKRTEKYKNKMTHGKTYNKSPRRINHKATKSKTNTRDHRLRTVGRANHRGV